MSVFVYFGQVPRTGMQFLNRMVVLVLRLLARCMHVRM